MGGVLDYVFLEAQSELPADQVHLSAALAAMGVIDRRRAVTPYAWDYEKLTVDELRCVGAPITFDAFWGSDDVALIPYDSGSLGVPEINGYKTAFCLPPYPLSAVERERDEIFISINAHVLGPDPRSCEIFSWSTDWSNYFDDGKIWWGAYFWTVRRPDSPRRLVGIGASASD